MSGISDWNGYVVLTGNPLDGFGLIGPFQGYDDAMNWAVNNLELSDFWITLVQSPDDLIKS